MEKRPPAPASLGPPPKATLGLHQWILEFTRRQILRGRSVSDTTERTLRLTKGLGRPEGELRREIEQATAGAAKWAKEHHLKPNGHQHHAPRIVGLSPWWYENQHLVSRSPGAKHWIAPVNEKLVRQILSKYSRDLLTRNKPDHFDLGELFAQRNLVLCTAQRVYQPEVRTLRQWQRSGDRLTGAQWLVPNAFVECGLGGRFKTDANSHGERFWLMIEFDQHSLEEQGRLLRWLEQRGAEEDWKLGLAVFSGGRSVHGWFSCVGRPEKETCQFFRLATSLGADKAMRSSVQFTRMPMGRNAKTQAVQEIIHWNPSAIDFHNRELRETQQRRMEALV